MQLRPAYPVDTVTGGCFITGRYELAPGEQIVDLDVDLEALPAWGRLCISELAVRLLMQQLGWELPEGNVLAANERLRGENKELRRECAELRRALGDIRDALPTRVVDVMETL